MSTPTSDEKSAAIIRAKANAAVGLLEAALGLITAAHREGPRGDFETAGDCVAINRAIEKFQQKLLRIHDENDK